MLGAGGARTAQQVAMQAAMDKMTVSRAVSGLLKRGLVVRSTSPKDRREQILKLTKTGRDIHDEIAPLALEQEKVLLQGLSSSEIDQLFRLLDELENRAIAAIAQD